MGPKKGGVRRMRTQYRSRNVVAEMCVKTLLSSWKCVPMPRYILATHAVSRNVVVKVLVKPPLVSGKFVLMPSCIRVTRNESRNIVSRRPSKTSTRNESHTLTQMKYAWSRSFGHHHTRNKERYHPPPKLKGNICQVGNFGNWQLNNKRGKIFLTQRSELSWAGRSNKSRNGSYNNN